MKRYRLITLTPLNLVTKNIGGKPAAMSVKDGYPAPTPPYTDPAEYAYVEELPFPEEVPAEGFVWARELTTEAYGWKQVEAPPAPDPTWYEQPAWRIRSIAKITPFGGGTLMDAINAAIEGTADVSQKIITEEVFYGGNTLHRTSPLLVAMATSLGLTGEQLDELFQQAGAIEI